MSPTAYVDVSPSYLEATINIHKAVPSYTKPTGLTAKEGQTLGDVASQLGTGFEFEDDPSTSVGGEGDNNFTVKYTPGDTENYQVITGILVTIHGMRAVLSTGSFISPLPSSFFRRASAALIAAVFSSTVC